MSIYRAMQESKVQSVVAKIEGVDRGGGDVLWSDICKWSGLKYPLPLFEALIAARESREIEETRILYALRDAGVRGDQRAMQVFCFHAPGSGRGRPLSVWVGDREEMVSRVIARMVEREVKGGWTDWEDVCEWAGVKERPLIEAVEATQRGDEDLDCRLLRALHVAGVRGWNPPREPFRFHSKQSGLGVDLSRWLGREMPEQPSRALNVFSRMRRICAPLVQCDPQTDESRGACSDERDGRTCALDGREKNI